MCGDSLRLVHHVALEEQVCLSEQRARVGGALPRCRDSIA